jgi:hypothetical protein
MYTHCTTLTLHTHRVRLLPVVMLGCYRRRTCHACSLDFNVNKQHLPPRAWCCRCPRRYLSINETLTPPPPDGYRNRRVSPYYHHSTRVSPWLHSSGSQKLTRCCTQRLLLGWAGKISSVLTRFELFSPYHGRLGECNWIFLADSTYISEQQII